MVRVITTCPNASPTPTLNAILWNTDQQKDFIHDHGGYYLLIEDDTAFNLPCVRSCGKVLKQSNRLSKGRTSKPFPPLPSRRIQAMDPKYIHYRMAPILPIVPQPGGLLRLPNHILLLVLQNIIRVADLYVLALVCRRLNQLSIPVFLSRFGISDPRTSAQITLQESLRRNKLVRVDALSGLRVALSLTSIDRLSCTFNFSEQSLSSFFAEFRRLQRLLTRLASVGQIIIDLRGGLHVLELSKDPEVVDEWAMAFNLLCETVTRRPENGLVIITSKLATRIYTSGQGETGNTRRQNSRLELPMRRRLLGGDKSLDSLNPRTAALMRPRSFSQPFAPRVTLTSFTVNSPSLLSHYLGWTLSVLRSAPVSCLILPDLQLPGLTWSSALPQIAAAVPFLSKLVISDPNIFPKDLLSFVSKLPLLESLKIDRSLRLFSQSPTHPKLPHLVTLSAPPEYASIFLAARGGLPQLQSLEVVLQNLTHVAVPHTTETLANIFHRLKEANSHVTPMLNIYVGSGSLQSTLSKSIDCSLNMGQDWQKCFRAVTDVVLDGVPLDEATRDRVNWAYLPRFLSILPQLERLTVRGPGDSRSKFIPSMIASISHRCTKLQKVVVNEMTHNVSAITTPSPIRADKKRLRITDLPEDILNHIFQYLSTELYSLSVVSRRFNMVAIPRFLEQQGIPSPAILSHVMPRESSPIPDALSGLQVALFIPSIDHLSCKFSRCSSIHAMFDQVYRFRRLVSRLTLVSKVTIDFGTAEHLKTANDMLLSKWVSLLGGLLNVILEKSCHTLTVIGGSHFLHTYQLRRRREPFLLKETISPMRGNTWMFVRASDQGTEVINAELSPKAQSASKLRNLTIESEMLMRPPFLAWTIATIKASPLVHLNVSEVPSELSQVVLPLLADAAPKLPELSLSGDLNPEEVLEFIDKFPQLRWLSLGRTLILDPEDTHSLPRPKLKRLTHLSAPLEFISYLTEKPIPSLKSVTVAMKNPSLANPNHVTLAHTLVGISRRLQSFSISPAFGIDIAVPASAAWMARDASVISANEPRWENAMKVITTVTLKNYDTLHCAIEDPSLPITRVLPKWVALFPGLQNVVLEEKQQSPLASFIPLGWAIMRACPDLTSVMVNGQYLQGQHRW